MLKIDWVSFSIPKLLHEKSENEDAVWPNRERISYIGNKFICAISDGATQASFSSLWAKLLVEYSAKANRKNPSLKDCINSAQIIWESSVKTDDLPWHAVEKARAGAYATLLTVQIYKYPQRSGGLLKLTAIGDSCLFLLRKDKLKFSYPIHHSESFGSTPQLLGSKEQANKSVWDGISDSTTHFRWFHGDQLILMTDALAQWFLRQNETGQLPINKFVYEINKPSFSENEFSNIVNYLRQHDKLKNDDTTLAWMSLWNR